MKHNNTTQTSTQSERAHRFEALKAEISREPHEGDLAQERAEELALLERQLGPSVVPLEFGDAHYFEVQEHIELPDDAPEREEARQILQRLFESSELRQALLPDLFRQRADRIGEWHGEWHALEKDREVLRSRLDSEDEAA